MNGADRGLDKGHLGLRIVLPGDDVAARGGADEFLDPALGFRRALAAHLHHNVIAAPPAGAVRGADAMAEQYASREAREAAQKLAVKAAEATLTLRNKARSPTTKKA